METLKLNAHAGNDIHEVANKAKEIAVARKMIVEFDFNEIQCLVGENTVVDWLIRDYMNAHIMEWKTVGHECRMTYDYDTEIELRTRQLDSARRWKKEAEERTKKEAEQQFIISEQTKGVELELSDAEGWNKSREANSDGYGSAALNYAEAWAKLMQIEIAKGKSVKECADATQKGLGYLGITGFQYGCVVSILSQCWKHGEDLRKWHNKKYGVSEDKQGVVNPAVLTLSK